MNTAVANLDAERFGIYGTDDEGNSTITYVRKLNHPIEKVWRAITVAEHRAAWFPELTLTTDVGGEAVVNFSGSDCPPPEDNPSDVNYCKVLACEPPNLLEYAGPRERHRFELESDGVGCVLKFLAMLPDANQFDDEAKTIQTRYGVACGWHYKLDQMQWDLDGVPFEDEGYAGPIKTEYYFVYRKMDKSSRD